MPRETSHNLQKTEKGGVWEKTGAKKDNNASSYDLHPKRCRGYESKEKEPCSENNQWRLFLERNHPQCGLLSSFLCVDSTQRKVDKSPRPYADTVNETDSSETSVFLKSLVKEMKERFLYQGQQIQQLMKAVIQSDIIHR